MPARLRTSVLLSALLLVATLALPAGANHNPFDEHSANTSLLFSSPNGRELTNSDMAFWGHHAYAGDYGGFRIFDITSPANPVLVGNLPCLGAQNDITVWDRNKDGSADIAFTSIDRTMTGPNCGATNSSAHDDPNGWEGLRIFDVSNPNTPTQIGSVYLDCGSHTNTLWPDPENNRVLLYNSSYPLRPGPTCGPVRGPENGRDPLHGVIQVVEVSWNPSNPLGPVTAKEIAEPKVVYPGDPDNKFVPAEHGLGATTDPNLIQGMRACHDLAVNVPLRLVAAACAEQAQVWRVKGNGIPDSAHPLWTYDDTVDETGTTGNPDDTGITVDFWHSATFSWDGSVVKFEDESFGGGCPTTTPVAGETASQSGDTGRLFFFDTHTGEKLSQFMPDASWEAEYCSAHLGNFVATDDGKKLLVYAWYLGGVTVIDVTDPTKPTRVAHYDAAGGIPPDASGPNGFDNWAAYWYEGPSLPGNSLTIYATDGVHEPTTGDGGARGFMSLRTDIAASEVNLDSLNPQTQRQLIPEVKCKGEVATVVGGPVGDVLEGTPEDDVIATLGGKDTVKGGKGDDTVCLGGGKDTGKGGGGDDLIVGEAGKDTCIGGPGSDKARKCEKTKSL